MSKGIESYVSRRMKLRIMAGETPLWMRAHIRGRYIVKSILSAPLWMHRSMLRPKRIEAERLMKETGIRYVLDHIVPIDRPDVCGLTVPWNIEVVPWAVNAYKGNRWHPDQQALALTARDPLQLRLFA